MSRILAVVALAFCVRPAIAANVHRQGKLDVSEYCSVDLDEGNSVCIVTLDGDERNRAQHSSDKAMDFWYQPDNKAHYLLPQHGVSFAKGSIAEAGFDGCSTSHYAKGRLRIDLFPVGTHICIRTNEGRYQ